jgi:hypothetical protein
VSEQSSQRELLPVRRHRFAAAAVVVEMFRNGPRLDWNRVREDLVEVVNQDITPRG